MPITSHLLERAYQLINANQIQNAELVLDAVVRVDPQNMEAWITYLQIHQDRSDLAWLKERILRTREISDQDKRELLQYHDALVQHLSEIREGAPEVGMSHVFNFKQEKLDLSKTENGAFELLDVFDFPAAIKEPAAGRKPRNRQRSGIDFNSQTSQAITLLLVFFAALGLFLGGHILGYLLLALFIAGSFYWLSNYKSNKTSHYTDSARMYLLDTKNNLDITDKKSADTKTGATKTPKS